MEQVNINVDEFTLGELAEFEKETGLTVSRLDYRNLPMKAVAGFVWLTQRRDNPDFTYEEATSRKAGEIQVVYEPFLETDPLDPTEGSSSESSLSSATSGD